MVQSNPSLITKDLSHQLIIVRVLYKRLPVSYPHVSNRSKPATFMFVTYTLIRPRGTIVEMLISSSFNIYAVFYSAMTFSAHNTSRGLLVDMGNRSGRSQTWTGRQERLAFLRIRSKLMEPEGQKHSKIVHRGLFIILDKTIRTLAWSETYYLKFRNMVM